MLIQHKNLLHLVQLVLLVHSFLVIQSVVASLGKFNFIHLILKRTAVNNEMGGSTPMSSVVTSLVVLIVLWLLTPAFQYLPKLILASIVVMSVRSLIDYKEALYLMKISVGELFVFAITFFSTLIVGIDNGIFLSIAVSMLGVLIRRYNFEVFLI